MGLFDRIAGKGQAASQEHFFVVSGNESLIDAFETIFTKGRVTQLGGQHEVYRADRGRIEARQKDARERSLPFDGQVHWGKKVEAAARIAEVLGGIRSSSPSGAFIAHVSVSSKHRKLGEETNLTLLQQAIGQGILPFQMYSTTNAEAADYLIHSLAAPVTA